MAYYKVLLHGKNFLLKFNDVIEEGGFCTTRWVKAADENEAELKAVDLIKNDKSLHSISIQKEGITPMIYLEEVEKVGFISFVLRQPGAGYVFYTGDDEED